MGIEEFVASPLGTGAGLILGAMLSFLITRWAIGKGEKTQLITAAAGIKGAADRLLTIDRTVTDLNNKVSDLSLRIESESADRQMANSAVVGNGELAGLLSTNKQLTVRLQQNAEEKMAVGKYIQRFVQPNASFVVDCGTSSAWAWFEMVRLGKMEYSVLTNNIFVASSISTEFHFSDSADTWGVDETASQCFLTEGAYFPSYGGILDLSQDSENRYLEKLKQRNPEVIMLGCTSFRAATGPNARSGPNRRFKRSLISYAVQNTDVQLFVLVNLAKIGRQIGEPCDVDLWQMLLERPNVHVLCGTTSLPKDLDLATDNEKSALQEEIRSLVLSQSRIRFVATDIAGTSIDLRSHW